MSFERLNSIFKEISSSQTYFSVQTQIEKNFFDENIEQEKFLRLCLRKLPDWFTQTPDQIKDIKIHFHTFFLRTSSRLKQRQLIDLLLQQLTDQFNDYFIYLLTDLYQTNDQKFFEELEQENDVNYLIHLPDRITNICRRNIPICFQAKFYFKRISEFIQHQLITIHYPAMLAQIDTNINFLSRLVHKAAKLGYTEYIWRGLLKTVFLKKSPEDSLYLRLAQYFLFDPIDEILLYTIEHTNAVTLNLFLSDRIVHQKSLEVYLTDTLLFRKQLSIETVRTIVGYLTMSKNRIEKCFENVFLRLIKIWSEESFIRFSSSEQHFYICQCICVCLGLNQTDIWKKYQDELIMCVLNGIRSHLESTFDYIRYRGQYLGELFVEKSELFPRENQLQFNTYNKNHPDILILNNLTQIDDRQLSDDEIDRSPMKKDSSISIPVNSISSTGPTIILREASIDDDDDADSEFECYDYSHDTKKAEVQKPNYLRTCLADLIATDKVPQLEAALQTLPSLIEMHKIEGEEIALELVRILLNYNSTFNIDNFHQLQLNGLVILCRNYPLIISDYLCKEFYERNYTISQRSLILQTIEETGKKLSQIEHIRKKIEDEFLSSDESEDSPESIINNRLKLKTKYKTSQRKPIISKENHFGNLVGHFFYPLLRQIDHSAPHLTLINGDNDYLLLCQLLACLGRLCIHAQNTNPLMNMIKQFFQLLKSLQQHRDAGVRHAMVYSYLCCLVSMNKTCYDEDLQMDLIELKQWFDEVIIKDLNTDVQKLTRSVRRILLKTLQEISENN